MNVEPQVVAILRNVLTLDAGQPLDGQTALIGHLPQLDSMAVVAILTALEEQFGFAIDDDEVDGSTFASVDSLTRFVASKLA